MTLATVIDLGLNPSGVRKWEKQDFPFDITKLEHGGGLDKSIRTII